MTENPMVIGAEVKDALCAWCGKPLGESDYTDVFGNPLCAKCSYWEESE